MKEILRYQHKYHKNTTKSNFILSIMLAVLLAATTNQFSNSGFIARIFITVFIVYAIFSNIKDGYFEDLYYLRIVDYSNRSDEPHLETYRKIKNESSWWKRVWFWMEKFGYEYYRYIIFIRYFSINVCLNFNLFGKARVYRRRLY